MLCSFKKILLEVGWGEMNDSVVTLLGSKWIKIPLEPSIQKKFVIRKREETRFLKKPLTMIISASENISPLRQCYVTSPSNKQPEL